MLIEVHTARKIHWPGCCVCMRAIRPGEAYERAAATPDDEIWGGNGWQHLKAHVPYGSCEGVAR
ncbi:hypothetical protein HII36_54085 [Nonomuraea sp. NN258]|uniref:hypothetical protein n=1 Tax=Nonomuraea antri TaxID=2730852 RepID=UPI00156A17B9|nr:hypothetical protein [Nonomuraea antri]NRQ40686.1 hypothetical protein [Nonomuraea antri]